MSTIIPNVFKITKNAFLLFADGAKHFIVDAALCVICIVAGIYWWFNPESSMVGAIAILFVYAAGNLIRFNNYRKIVEELKKLNK